MGRKENQGIYGKRKIRNLILTIKKITSQIFKNLRNIFPQKLKYLNGLNHTNKKLQSQNKLIMEAYDKEKLDYDRAYERVQKMKKFYKSVFFFLIIFGAYSAYRISRTGNILDGFNRISTIFIIWGIILAVKGVKLFFLNSEWENDMIKK